jgi:hypothetical protein
MLQQSYKLDDQGGPQPPKPPNWKEGDPLPSQQEKEKKEEPKQSS